MNDKQYIIKFFFTLWTSSTPLSEYYCNQEFISWFFVKDL